MVYKMSKEMIFALLLVVVLCLTSACGQEDRSRQSLSGDDNVTTNCILTTLNLTTKLEFLKCHLDKIKVCSYSIIYKWSVDLSCKIHRL